MRRIGPFLLLLGLLLTLTGCGAGPELKGTVITPPRAAPDLTLTDEQGQPFTLSAQKGKVTVLFFGFTNCPDICPTALSSLAAANRQLGDDAKAVQIALVTLDPERDTVEKLRQYVTAFDPSFKGLHGDTATLDPIVKEYGVSYERRELPDSALRYTIDHSGFMYLIDKSGRWREVLAHGTPVEDIAADLRALARERS